MPRLLLTEKGILNMWKYPLKTDENELCKHMVTVDDAYKWCNESFYYGFIAAHCQTPEEYEAIGSYERTVFALAAIERNAILRREEPQQCPDFIKEALKAESGDMDLAVAKDR